MDKLLPVFEVLARDVYGLQMAFADYDRNRKNPKTGQNPAVRWSERAAYDVLALRKGWPRR